jgi:hypothetical protein
VSVSTTASAEVIGPQELRGFTEHAAVHSPWFVPSVEALTFDQSLNPTRERDEIAPFLLLGIMGAIVPTVVRVSGRRHALNYGLDEVRFAAPLARGDRMRVSVELASVDGPGEWLDGRWTIRAEGPIDGRLILSAVLIVRYFFEKRP